MRNCDARGHSNMPAAALCLAAQTLRDKLFQPSSSPCSLYDNRHRACSSSLRSLARFLTCILCRHTRALGTRNKRIRIVVCASSAFEFETVRAAVSEDWLATAIENAKPRNVSLALPKLEMNVRSELTQTLMDLGAENSGW